MFCISMGLPILDISNKWNHIICDFCVWLLLLVIKLSRFYHTVAWTSTSLLLLVNNNLWYEYSILCLYSHQLIGIWIVSTFWLLRIMSIWCSCKSFYIHVGVCMLSHFSPVWRLVTLWTVAHQALLSMEFSRQEYWSGLPCPPPGDPPDPDWGIKPMFPALQQILYPLSHLGSPFYMHM